MGKLSEQDATRTTGPKGCAVTRILDDLDDEDRQLLLTWLHDPHTGDPAIENRLGEAGYRVSDSTIRRWRRRNGIKTVWAA